MDKTARKIPTAHYIGMQVEQDYYLVNPPVTFRDYEDNEKVTDLICASSSTVVTPCETLVFPACLDDGTYTILDFMDIGGNMHDGNMDRDLAVRNMGYTVL